VSYPSIQQMNNGVGEIQIEFTAELSGGNGNRKLVIENHHQSRISAYLVNCLKPVERDIRVVAQNRNETQSFYQLSYVRGDDRDGEPFSRWWSGVLTWLSSGGMGSMFRLGMRHIAEGTDHLLFLLALLLPAPLIACGSRWAGFAGLRHSLTQILKVVTAFTLGHSITLALAGLGVVLVPSRPIEVLIAISILVSALHALRPIFPGREAIIAAFFGLIHGLAFAATLGQLGLERWMRVANIFAFNVGIEAMQLVVVAATIPSLVLLSRVRGYSFFRVGGAIFAGVASVGWIAERLLNVNLAVDSLVGSIAHDAVRIAIGLFLTSLLCWRFLRNTRKTVAVSDLPPEALRSSFLSVGGERPRPLCLRRIGAGNAPIAGPGSDGGLGMVFDGDSDGVISRLGVGIGS
jgi:HupE/UreJ protein